MGIWSTVRDFLTPKQAPVAPPPAPTAHEPRITESVFKGKIDTSSTPKPGTLIEPGFPPLVSNTDRARVYGKFSYIHAPNRDNPERIKVTDDWAQDNIKFIHIPQLVEVPGADTLYERPGMYFHVRGERQLVAMWQAWDDAGLIDRVLSFDGSYVARFVRGSRTTLSNHAWGCAFDINYEWNKLGAVPARIGAEGSVRELVPIATAHGFYWGGFYHNRQDGMHFELAKPL